MRGHTDISEIKENGSIDSTDRLRIIALIFIHIHEFNTAAGVALECFMSPSSVKEKIVIKNVNLLCICLVILTSFCSLCSDNFTHS